MTTDIISIGTNPSDSKQSAIDQVTSALSHSNASSGQTSVHSVSNSDEIFDWRRTDSLRFVFQILLTITILVFCLSKMADAEQNKENSTAYWGAITGLVAWWMPSPGKVGNVSNSSKSNT